MAVIVAEVTLATAVVVTVKVAVVAPAATVTVGGTVALPVLDVRLIDVPPVGAGAPRVTVPVEGEPPVTVAGERETAVSDAELIVRFALTVTSPRLGFAERALAEMEAICVELTAVVVTVNVAVVAPALTVTVEGTVAAVELDAN